MILLELFNTVYPVAVTADEENLFRMAFFDPVALVPVVTTCKKLEFDDNRSGWEIQFKRGGEVSITKQKNAYKIFSTVLECIKQFINERDPEVILFSAFEPSRQGLYRAMINKFLNTTNYRSATDADFEELGGRELFDLGAFVLLKNETSRTNY